MVKRNRRTNIGYSWTLNKEKIAFLEQLSTNIARNKETYTSTRSLHYQTTDLFEGMRGEMGREKWRNIDASISYHRLYTNKPS